MGVIGVCFFIAIAYSTGIQVEGAVVEGMVRHFRLGALVAAVAHGIVGWGVMRQIKLFSWALVTKRHDVTDRKYRPKNIADQKKK